MTLDLSLRPRGRSRLASLALSIAVFALCVAAYSAVLLRTRSVESASAFAAFASSLVLAAVAVLVGVVAMAVVWVTGRRGGVRAMFAVALSVLLLAGPAYVVAKGHAGAQLDDVSTDLADPPRLDRAARDRSAGDLPAPPAAIAPAQAERQRAAFPDLVSLRLNLPVEDVSDLAIGLVTDRGWTFAGPTAYPRGGPPTGRIEAVARSPLLGLKSDVAIRVLREDAGSRVDMRSASRVGGVDFGDNAERIRIFLADLAAAANAAAP